MVQYNIIVPQWTSDEHQFYMPTVINKDNIMTPQSILFAFGV